MLRRCAGVGWAACDEEVEGNRNVTYHRSGVALGCALLTAGCGKVSDVSPDAAAGGALEVVTTGLPDGNRELPYEVELEASGGEPPYTWSAANLPPGLAAGSDGVITGTPIEPGNYDATITVTDDAGATAAARFPLAIANDVIITTGALPPAHIFEHYEAPIEVVGGEPPHSFSGVGLPPGLVIAADTGIIASAPAAPAILEARTATVTITAVDAAGISDVVSMPLEIIGLAPAPAVGDTLSAGANSTCAVDTAGGAWCWGFNEAGALGAGLDFEALEESTFPLPVVAEQGQAFASISVGSFHSCAVDDEGGAWCWGNNEFGELGTGQDGNALEKSAVPLPVIADEDQTYVSISAGSHHSCAVDDEGGVWCWGNNEFGELGTGQDGNGLQQTAEPRPVVADHGQSFVSIAAGFDQACALDDEGEAWCWGTNENGRLGGGQDRERLEQSAVPLPVVAVEGQTFVSISTGFGVNCALDDEGGAWCWGTNQNGQLGTGQDGDALEDSAAPVPVVADDGQTFARISAGTAMGCAVDDAGEAWCWGFNGSGRLGTGQDFDELANSPVPLSVAGDEGLAFVAIAGAAHTCAATESGIAWCWGSNARGQLGTGQAGSELLDSPLPLLVQPAPARSDP